MATTTVEKLVSTLSVSSDQTSKINGSGNRRDLLTTINYFDEAQELENQAKAKEANGTEEEEKSKPKVLGDTHHTIAFVALR
jgi:hypothetical protein